MTKNGKSLYLLGLLSSLRGHCPLHTDGFLVLHTYEQPWGSFPLLWCIWNTLGVRVFRNILSLVACGWSLDLTCLYLLLMGIQWSLVSGCLGIRDLAGIIIFGRVAGKSKLAGNQHLCFICLWFSIRHTHLLKECNQLKKKSKDVAEWEQKAAGRAGWPGGILWWRKEFCDETSKNIHPKCKAAAGRMMCIRGRLPSWLTIHIDNPL